MLVWLFSVLIATMLAFTPPSFADRVDDCAWNLRIMVSTKMGNGWKWADVPLWVYEEVCSADWNNKLVRDEILQTSPETIVLWAERQKEMRGE